MTSMMVSNCSLIPTKEVEIVSKPVERVITQPIMPREIDLKEVMWLTITPENYEELLLNNGFKVKEKNIENVHVPLDGWYEISSFKDWIEGVLPGIPLDIGKKVLQETVESLFKELNIKTLDRKWLSIVASKS